MGLLFPDDPHYDPSQRQTGFYRYRQLLSDHFGHWLKLNLLTLLGLLPLAVGILYSIFTSSILVLLPCSLLGGMMFGPFLAALYDGIFRGLRDDPRPWWDNYKRGWRQNWRGSLLPGAILGLCLGIYAFFGMMLLWWAEVAPSAGTIVLALTGLVLLMMFGSIYWPQLVLFRQSAGIRLRNCILFSIRYFWPVLGVSVLQVAYWLVHILFAPWSLLLLPVVGIWYILFLSCFLLYRRMNEAFHMEEEIAQHDPEEVIV